MESCIIDTEQLVSQLGDYNQKRSLIVTALIHDAATPSTTIH